MKENNNFKMGMRDGAAIGVGYLAVACGGALSVLIVEVIIMLVSV